jgi:hypothetical protein
MMKQVEQMKKEKAEPWEKVERICISFVRDDHQKYAPLADARYLNLKIKSANAAEYMGSHTIADDKKVFVLQAADAVAYEIRRVLHTVHKQWSDPIRSQFKIFENTVKMAIIQTAKKENLLNTVRLHKPGEAFNLDEIMGEVFHENVVFDI